MNAISRRGPAPAAAVLLALLFAGTCAVAQGGPSQMPPASATTTAASATRDPDIRDIRGPQPVGSPWLVPMIAITILIAAGGWYAAWAWNRRRLRETPPLPHEIALARLDGARDLVPLGRAREFSIDVSDIVREYIEGRFDVRAAHLTTDEFLRTLTSTGDTPLAANRMLLDEFLQACDLAKFGGWNLTASEMEALLQGARRFVVESQPLAVRTSPPRSHPITSREGHASLSTT